MLIEFCPNWVHCFCSLYQVRCRFHGVNEGDGANAVGRCLFCYAFACASDSAGAENCKAALLDLTLLPSVRSVLATKLYYVSHILLYFYV